VTTTVTDATLYSCGGPMQVAASVLQQANAWWLGISSLAPLAVVFLLVVARLVREVRQERPQPLSAERERPNSDQVTARPG
jgi:membrane protein implicated in regulation of membrane protease activity